MFCEGSLHDIRYNDKLVKCKCHLAFGQDSKAVKAGPYVERDAARPGRWGTRPNARVGPPRGRGCCIMRMLQGACLLFLGSVESVSPVRHRANLPQERCCVGPAAGLRVYGLGVRVGRQRLSLSAVPQHRAALVVVLLRYGSPGFRSLSTAPLCRRHPAPTRCAAPRPAAAAPA